ncbi:MAG: ferric reductase-like transmembrane domain-containing protein [Paracoccaceae bacterium]
MSPSTQGQTGTYALWALIAVPGAIVVGAGLAHIKLPFVNVTGVLGGLFLALTLTVTPIQRLFGPFSWLKDKRRYLGVASAAYLALHLAVWLAEITPDRFIGSFTRPELLVGWVAGVIMVPLAATSFDGAVRVLGPRWKALHRWVYAAAAFTLAHWYFSGEFIRTCIAAALAVIAAEAMRLMKARSRRIGG